MSGEKLDVDPLVGGLTRPPMMLGVPYSVFVLEICAVVLIFINSKNLLTLLLWPPLHAIAYVLTVRDARFLDIIITRFSKAPLTRNRRFWGGDSYSP